MVRSGPNTLQPYRENPPDRTIAADDIVFLDFGPIFAEWEADFGRTYVLGDDPVKHRLAADLPRVFAAGRDHFDAHPDITGAELYAHVVGLAEAAGWTFGGPHSGHLVGEFPHELIDGERIESYIAPGSDGPMRRTDPQRQAVPLDPGGAPRRPRTRDRRVLRAAPHGAPPGRAMTRPPRGAGARTRPARRRRAAAA